ncbi:TatD family hydrolase [Candidatus Chloroploca asiatica]|uniref:Hydrolase TatD n=1 Tax=Candidatus Chloroploca asiatica TaxID=1506545 RepID=A0A2H3KFL3_9CHLR|nr:TatD family hydrolase [Candidatus Chloroploca asiatica]PDV96473.1 hydrolase TatD [Candidatus Chloroploca asiatica]
MSDGSIPFIDTHAHVALAQFDADREAVLTRAAADGVTRIIEIGYDLPSSRAALALAEAYPQIFAVVGVQPNHVADLPPDWLHQVRDLARHPKVVAVGEIGLDYHWMRASPEAQALVFRQQLDLARSLDLPVVIHSRDAHDDTVQVLAESARGVPGVMHSFSGDWAYAQICLELNFLLSFSGPLTFPKATILHEVARRAPLTMLLTETDSPYLSPHPYRGKRNEPARVRLVTEQLAALREQPLAEVATTVDANAQRIFPRMR